MLLNALPAPESTNAAATLLSMRYVVGGVPSSDGEIADVIVSIKTYCDPVVVTVP